MIKKYFIWKNPDCEGINPEYIEVSGKKFYEINKSNSRKRYFKQIDEGVEFGMEVYVMETTYSDYLEWDRERKKRQRKNKEQEEYQPKFVCLNDFVADSELTYEEVIADENANVEEEVMRILECQKLRQVVNSLNSEEQELLNLILFCFEHGISERKFCEEKGYNREEFRYKREKIFKKIKKFFPKT